MPVPPNEDQPIEGPRVEWKAEGVASTETTRLAEDQVESRSLAEARDDALLEKIIGEKNNLRPVAFLEKGIQLARSVAHITIPNRGVASGFMIGASVLMTNHHVFGSADEAKGATIRFNYQTDLQGNLLPTEQFATDPDAVFWTSPEGELDCSVVGVQGSPGLTWGFLALPPATHVRVGDDVVIIQHPAGEPKQIGLTDNEVEFVDERVAQYLTDTLPGSSGSPVFDDQWGLIALHHSGGWLPEPSTSSTHYRNEGILISAIQKELTAAQVPFEQA